MIKYSVVNYIFGAPGVGKTTMLAYLSRYFLKHKFKVYTNFPLKDCIQIEDESLGYYNFNDSILLLDEFGVSASNRSFADKHALMNDKSRLSYMKRIRHYLQRSRNGACFVATQGWNDVDKKVRDLSTSYYLLTKWFGLTILKPIFKDCKVDPLLHEPADYFDIQMLTEWRIIWRRRYYKYFDSYDAPELPDYPAPEGWRWIWEKEESEECITGDVETVKDNVS